MPMGPTAICNNNNNNNNSRRKQAKPQRLIANGVDESVPVDDAVFLTKNAGNGGNKMEVDDAHTGTDPQPSSISPPSTSTGASQSSPAVTNSSSSSSSSSPPIDCHVCGNCSQQFDDVGDFVDHKKLCHRRDEMTPPMVSEVVSSTKTTLLPIDLSSKKNGLLIESGTTTNNEFDYAAFQHHQQLLDFYAKFAQQQQPSVTSSSSSSSSDLLLSPPTSNDPIDLHHHHHVCSVDDQQFRSRAALLWHTLRQHPDDGRLQCDRCERRFVDGDDLQMHRCDDRRRPTRALSVDGADAEEAEDGRRNYCCVSRSSLPDRLNTQFQLVAASTAPPMVPAFDLQKQQQMLAVFDLPLDLTQQCNVIRQLSPPPPRPPPMTIDCQPPPLPPPPIYRPPPPTSASSSSLALANDDDWESLMEVSQTDEAEKIRALVGDKALPTTDPNQCLLCRRVLSCKSALQMHYRTHTGERPFKCKICQRAFTTKGNLKTHMGVHRAKHPFRNNTSGNTTTTIGQHQCPICQKRLVSGVQLQQHIAQVHTHQLTTRNSADGGGGAIAVASSPPRSDQQLMNQLFAVGLPPPPPAAPFPLPVTSSSSAAAAYAAFSSMFAASIPPPPMIMMPTPFNATQSSSILPQPTAPSSPPPPSTTTTTCNICYKSFACYSALEIHYRDCCRSHTKDRPYKCGECSRAFSTKGNMKQHALTHRQQQQQPSDADHDMHHSSTPEGSVDESNDAPHRSLATSVSVGSIIDCAESESEKVDELDEDDKLMVVADEDQHDDPNPLDAIQKMWAQTVPPPPRQVPILSKHQCGVCFKHFSSSSALQIHLRTHSGEKPFKCHICDRAFTTRGNLKVHMGTHAWQNPSRRGRRIFEFSPPPSGSSVDNSTTAQQPPLNYFQAPETSSNASSTSSTSSSIDKLFNSHPAPFCFPLPGCFGGGASASTPNMEAMMWMWRTVCSVCQKVCASPAELEDHLKLHLQQHHTNTASSSSMFRC